MSPLFPWKKPTIFFSHHRLSVRQYHKKLTNFFLVTITFVDFIGVSPPGWCHPGRSAPLSLVTPLFGLYVCADLLINSPYYRYLRANALSPVRYYSTYRYGDRPWSPSRSQSIHDRVERALRRDRSLERRYDLYPYSVCVLVDLLLTATDFVCWKQQHYRSKGGCLTTGEYRQTMVHVWVAGKNCVIPLLHTGRVLLLVAVLRDSLLGLSLLYCATAFVRLSAWLDYNTVNAAYCYYYYYYRKRTSKPVTTRRHMRAAYSRVARIFSGGAPVGS